LQALYFFGFALFHLGKLADIIEVLDACYGVAVDEAGVVIMAVQR
jgi:hypothetical protein